MNVLIVDMLGCRFPDLGFQIKTAFESLGHTVRTFDYRKWKLQHFSLTNKLLNRIIIHTAVSWPADLVLVSKGESILPGTIERISSQGIKTVNWEPDEPFGDLQPFNKIQNVGEYDYFFMYDKQYVKRLKELNPHTYYLPAGADPFGVHKEYIPIDERKFPADICLVGTAYQNRIELMSTQLNKKLLIAGPGWDTTSENLKNISLPPIKIVEMTKFFNNAKVVLNPYGPSKSFIVPNPRTFEIPATMSFQLTDMSRDVDDFFKKGKEIDVYKDVKEFEELVEYYLEDDDARTKIARAGYQRVLKEHTIRHRVEEVLRIVGLSKKSVEEKKYSS